MFSDPNAHNVPQLNVRVPSMLILRDRLKSNPHSVPVDMADLMAGHSAEAAVSPDPISFQSPAEKQEAAHRKVILRQTEELKKKAVEATGNMDEWTVKTWLQL